MTSDNQTYRDTELLKLGIKKLKSPFLELAKWISSKYMAEVLNITYDLAIPDSRPRLEIILNTNKDVLRLESPFKPDPLLKKEIREKFEDLLKQQNNNNYQTEFLFVIFSSFELASKIKTNESITKEEIENLKVKTNREDLWEIKIFHDSVTFFYRTDKQIEENETSGLNKIISNEYLNLLHKHDRYGYFSEGLPQISFDSKENFDKNYNGSWFYYYR